MKNKAVLSLCSCPIHRAGFIGRPRPNKAYTLLELIVVMGIAVLVIGMSVPSFVKFNNTARLRSAAREITSALRSARRYAITQCTEYITTIYMIGNSNIENAVSFYETMDSVKVKYLAGTIYACDILGGPDFSSTGKVFTFSPHGTVGGGTVYVVDADDRYIGVTVLGVTGRVKIGDINE